MSHTLMSFVTFIFISESYFLFINSRVLLLVVENKNFCYHNSIPRKLVILYNRIHNTKSGIGFLIINASFIFIVMTELRFSSVQSLSHVRLIATPWTAACQASLSITNSQGLLKLMSVTSVMPSNHLILSSPSPPTFSLIQHEAVFR